MSINIEEIMRNKPFRRKSYVAMLLGFYPYNYTRDALDNEIIYGDELKKLKFALSFIQCIRLLDSSGLKNEDSMNALRKHYVARDWNGFLNEIKKYNVDSSVIEIAPWQYFRSYQLEKNYPSFHSNDVRHRLYINVKLPKRAEFTKKFIDQCICDKNPYYFKVLAQKGQTDTIVIYIDTEENLTETINIINKVLTANPEIKKAAQEPAPHLYKVNDYIGYGFETPVIDGTKQSYTQLLKECSDEDEVHLKRVTLRNLILNDFEKGIYYTSNPEIPIPSLEEMNKFSRLNKTEQGIFFIKYFDYLLEAYGDEIKEIVARIEENMEQKLKKSQGKKI